MQAWSTFIRPMSTETKMASARLYTVALDSTWRSSLLLLCLSFAHHARVSLSQISTPCPASDVTSPSEVYAMYGDAANFSCSSDKSVTELTLSVTPGPSQLTGYEDFPGYFTNNFVDGVLTVFFNLSVGMANQSFVRCCWDCCTVSQVDILRPGPPLKVDESSIEITPGVSSADFTWKIPWSYPNYPILSYNISVLNSQTSLVEQTVVATSNSARFDNLYSNVSYHLNIVAVSRSGTSESSSLIFETLALGALTSAPSSLSLVVPHKPTTLTWSYELEAEVTAEPLFIFDGTAYTLASLNQLSEVSVVATASSTAVTVTVDGMPNRTMLEWRLEQFGSGLSSTVQIVVASKPLAPPIPASFTISPIALGIVLSAPFSHAPIANYTVTYRPTADGQSSSVSRTASTLLGFEAEPVKVTLSDLRAQTQYTVSVVAGSEVGSSPLTAADVSLGDVEPRVCLQTNDMTWGFVWEFSFPGQESKQICIDGLQDSGVATRLCSEGVWSEPTISDCRTPSIAQLDTNVSAVSMSSCYTPSVIRSCLDQVPAMMETLHSAAVTSDRLFPSDIETAANALHETSSLERAAVSQSISIPLELEVTADHYIGVFDSLFDRSQWRAWRLVNLDNSSLAADQVLYSFIRTLSIVVSLNPGDFDRMRTNFVAAEVGSSTSSRGVDVHLAGECVGQSFVALVDNFASFLPPIWPSGITAASASTPLVAVGSTCGNTSAEVLSVAFTFSETPSCPVCVAWKFVSANERVSGRGAWSTEGVRTDADKWSATVTCHSTQILPLTVLSDPQGPDCTAAPVSIALYIGSVVAALLFLVSIVPLASFIHSERKADKRVVLNVAQVNYAAVNAVSLVVLAAGIESARNPDTSSTVVYLGCKVIAALLQYLYLCVAVWVLLIALVLVCLYAEMGRALVKRWWPPLFAAYIAPIPVVIISAPVAHNYYGSDLGCWLSFRNGTVFGFVVPAVAVIVAAVVVFTVCFGFICKYRKIDAAKDSDAEVIALRKELIGTVVMYVAAHFPLLCLVWVFEFVYLGTGMEPFAIVFAVLSMAQGSIFATFQILRISQIRRFWTENIYRRLKVLFIVERQPTPPLSIANTLRTGRYVADGRLGAGVSVMESTDFSPDFSPFGGDTDTSTNKTDSTFVYNW